LAKAISIGFRSGEQGGRSCRLGCLASMAWRNLRTLMGPGIVDADDVGSLPGRAEHRLDVGQEPGAVDRAIQDERRLRTRWTSFCRVSGSFRRRWRGPRRAAARRSGMRRQVRCDELAVDPTATTRRPGSCWIGRKRGGAKGGSASPLLPSPARQLRLTVRWQVLLHTQKRTSPGVRFERNRSSWRSLLMGSMAPPASPLRAARCYLARTNLCAEGSLVLH
jgi:hypothetical protein